MGDYLRFFKTSFLLQNIKKMVLELGQYAQGNYPQTEITPKEIKLFKANSSDFFRLLFEEVKIFVVWLGRFAPFAK